MLAGATLWPVDAPPARSRMTPAASAAERVARFRRQRPLRCAAGWRAIGASPGDAGAGIVVGPLAGYTRRVQQGLTKRESFGGLIAAIRNGPPRLSVFGLPGVDERANLVEFFDTHAAHLAANQIVMEDDSDRLAAQDLLSRFIETAKQQQ